MVKISFVIPCYNAARNIELVFNEIVETMAQRPSVEYEVILVDDQSSDNTFAVISELARANRHVTALNLARNVGQPSALLAGMRQSTGDVVMTSDDDGQTPVSQVFNFLAEIEKGYDVVCGRYTDRHQPSLFRRLGSAVNRGMSDWLIQKPPGVYMSAFFMARRFVVDEMVRYQHAYPYISALIHRVTQNVGNVDVEQRQRASGVSGYNFSKLFKLWMNGFTAFSVKPLRLAAKAGSLISVLGFLIALIAVIRKIVVPTVAIGWTSIVALTLFLNGVVLIFLGLIGEYCGRMYMCVNQTPQYVIRERIVGSDIQEEHQP